MRLVNYIVSPHNGTASPQVIQASSKFDAKKKYKHKNPQVVGSLNVEEQHATTETAPTTKVGLRVNE